MIRFAELDGCLLWCLPDPGCDLGYWAWSYTFINRDAAPNYDELAGCVDRAVRAGLMSAPSGGHFVLTPEWLKQSRAWAGQVTIPEYGMIAFAERLEAGEWPEVNPAGFVLDRDDYEKAAPALPLRRG